MKSQPVHYRIPLSDSYPQSPEELSQPLCGIQILIQGSKGRGKYPVALQPAEFPVGRGILPLPPSGLGQKSLSPGEFAQGLSSRMQPVKGEIQLLARPQP